MRIEKNESIKKEYISVDTDRIMFEYYCKTIGKELFPHLIKHPSKVTIHQEIKDTNTHRQYIFIVDVEEVKHETQVSRKRNKTFKRHSVQ